MNKAIKLAIAIIVFITFPFWLALLTDLVSWKKP
jgi:hypothetical protein